MNNLIKLYRDECVVAFISTGKYWVGNSDGSISNNRMISGKLTDEEDKIYTYGKNKKFGFDIVEFGYDLYTHKDNGCEIRIPKFLS